jgi:hypothetical protein
MSRRKVSTLLDEHLFRRAKLESVRQGKQISVLIGEALQEYLKVSASRRARSRVVEDSWGVLKLDRRRVQRLLREEEGWLDA